MKSIVKTIIVLALFGLLTVSSAPAQESGEASTEAVAETIGSTDSAVATPSPSKEPALPPPSIGVVSPTADESVVIDNLFVEPSGGVSTYALATSTADRSSSSSRKVLVIPNAEIKAEDLVVITQDLQVMAHIFHKIFTGPRLIEGIFEDYGDFFGRGSRTTESVYLQGYGVLFLMEVNIPLSSPPKAKETEKDENTQKADSVWNQAKQEIFRPSPTRNTRAFDSTEIYDAEKVEELKSRLIKALKHAANVRNLKADELIILTVIGKGRSYVSTISGGGVGGYGGGMSGYTDSGGSVKSYRRTRGRYGKTTSVPGGIGVSASTVLTIRAKKSDVDAFAKGELDYDKFREKVQILTYPYFGLKSVRPTPSRIVM
ncbi:MAG: hypothetical protein ACYS91_11245 [Planctomycetota bacterium]|jgi:hypothetical protein